MAVSNFDDGKAGKGNVKHDAVTSALGKRSMAYAKLLFYGLSAMVMKKAGPSAPSVVSQASIVMAETTFSGLGWGLGGRFRSPNKLPVMSCTPRIFNTCKNAKSPAEMRI